MNDPIRRGLRGALQLSVAEIFVQFVEAFLMPLNEAQHVAALGGLTLVVTFVQNYLEDKEVIRAVIKGKK